MSRTAIRKQVDGGALRKRLERQGIAVRASSARGLAEEAPEAYKDVEHVVGIVERAGLAARVARLHPIGVLKG
jgi:tRNA-splicing ligase RtcB